MALFRCLLFVDMICFMDVLHCVGHPLYMYFYDTGLEIPRLLNKKI